MTSPLQKAPSGLLGLFSLKTLGRNPQEFGDLVAPVTDVTDLYALDVLTSDFATANISAAGAVTRLAVPNGVNWRLRGIQASVNVAAATAWTDDCVSLSVGVQIDLSQNPQFLRTAIFPSVSPCTTEFVVRASLYLSRPLVLPPGAAVVASLNTTLSAASAVVATALYEPLPV